MIYHIEYLRWDNGNPDPEIIARASQDFNNQDDAFTYAKQQLEKTAMKNKVEAFRIFQDGDSPEPLSEEDAARLRGATTTKR